LLQIFEDEERDKKSDGRATMLSEGRTILLSLLMKPILRLKNYEFLFKVNNGGGEE
jgi:hypothetical protein